MGQKIDYDFRFKKRLHLMDVNQLFSALLTVKCSAFYSEQKCVRDFP